MLGGRGGGGGSSSYVPRVQVYCRTGVPPQLRRCIWSAAMGVDIGAELSEGPDCDEDGDAAGGDRGADDEDFGDVEMSHDEEASPHEGE